MKNFEFESHHLMEDLACLLDDYIDPDDRGLFEGQTDKALDNLKQKPEADSAPLRYPPLSTYGYRKLKFHSIPLHLKTKREWEDVRADLRVIFKVREEEGVIYILGIGKRIKAVPRDPEDIYSQVAHRPLPEE